MNEEMMVMTEREYTSAQVGLQLWSGIENIRDCISELSSDKQASVRQHLRAIEQALFGPFDIYA